MGHMGPGEGIQIQRLMDLPTTLETAEAGGTGSPGSTISQNTASAASSVTAASSSQLGSASGVQRVKSLLQSAGGGVSPGGVGSLSAGSSGSKLPSRLPSGGVSQPPQRSISHNEEMGIDGRSPRHSLGSNSSNLSSPPSPLVRAGESHGGAQHVLHHSNRVSTQSTHSSSAGGGGGGGGHPTYENH